LVVDKDEHWANLANLSDEGYNDAEEGDEETDPYAA
jgi:hypothetical protein